MLTSADIIRGIKRARLEQGFSQGLVATRARTRQSRVSEFESETTDPSLSTVLALAGAVGLRLVLVPDGRRRSADIGRIASVGELILGTINAPRPRKLDLTTLIDLIKGKVQGSEWAAHAQSLFEEVGIAPIHNLVLAGAVSFRELDATRRHWRIEHGETADWISEMAALELGRPPSHDDRDPRYAP